MAHSAIMSVRITGNADDAVKAFERTTTRAAAFGSALGGLAVKGVTALWDTVKGFTSDVISMSDGTGKFMNTMSFAGIDSSAVTAAAKAARKYADDTVYDLSTIQNTTAQLAANGIGNYTELTEAAGNLNAVAGGNADTFKSVAMMLTQTAGAGKLTTENWNQLADAIPGASGKLQEALLKNGAYTGNFRDAMAKGEITADEFNQALLDLGMTDVAKQAATSTQTIEGAMGNLEAAVTGGLTDAFNLFKPTVTGAINTASTAVTGLATSGVANLTKFLDQVRDTGAFTTMAAAAATVGDGLRSLWNGITTVVNAMTGGQPAGTSFGNVLNTVAATAQALLNAVMAANPIMLLVTAIAALVAGLVYFFTQTQTGRQIWSDFTAFISQCVTSIIGFFTSLGSSIGTALTNAANGARNVWNGVVNWFGSIPSKIKGFFSNAGSILKDAGAAIINGFLNGLKGAWNNVTGWIGGIGDWIKEHKGPPAYDAILLTDNGRLIMQGFAKGLNQGFDTSVAAAIRRANTRLGKLDLHMGTDCTAAGNTTIFNVTIQGEVLDREGTTKTIRRLLDDYADRRR